MMGVFAVMQQATPRTRAAIRSALMEDLAPAKQDTDAPTNSSVVKNDPGASSSNSEVQGTVMQKSDISLCSRAQCELRKWRADAVVRKIREAKDRKLALELAKEWGKENASGLHNAQSEAEREECVICFEKAVQPVGCIFCKQLVGCLSCVMKWHKTFNVYSNVERAPLLSSTHRSCPLCRNDWLLVPKVEAWENMKLKKELLQSQPK